MIIAAECATDCSFMALIAGRSCQNHVLVMATGVRSAVANEGAAVFVAGGAAGCCTPGRSYNWKRNCTVRTDMAGGAGTGKVSAIPAEGSCQIDKRRIGASVAFAVISIATCTAWIMTAAAGNAANGDMHYMTPCCIRVVRAGRLTAATCSAMAAAATVASIRRVGFHMTGTAIGRRTCSRVRGRRISIGMTARS